MAQKLHDLKIAIIAGDMFEESEMTMPQQALEQAGATTVLISPKPGKITAAKHFDKSNQYQVDLTLEQARPQDFDALLLPGGALNADQLRVIPAAQHFVRAFYQANKPMAIICHAPWLLVSAGLTQGRVLTSYHTIADDLRNAGATWLDVPVVRDVNWVTSRQPSDIPDFNAAMISLIEETGASSATESQPVTGRTEYAFGERREEKSGD